MHQAAIVLWGGMAMIPMVGSSKTLCDGLTRRELMRIGGLAPFAFGLSDWLRLQSEARADTRPASFGKAKSCILLFLFGSPPQHETFDPKPDAPAEIQGELKAISTSLPGLSIGERLPLVSRVMDRVTTVRSMTHPYPLHGVAYALTGMPTYTPEIEAKPRDPQHWPFLGSVVDYLEATQQPRVVPPLPRNIGLPWVLGSKQTDYPPLAGPFAAFLGTPHDPVWTDFTGKGTRVVPKLNDNQTQDVYDPFAGIEPGGRLQLASASSPPDLTPARLGQRRFLLEQFDQRRRWLEQYAGVRSYDRQQDSAYSLLTTSRMQEALDVDRETPQVRERYGATLFGQATLAARRLVEAGARFVSVFWDPFGPFGGSCWDTHANHYPRLKEYLLPVFDQTYSALILDLEARGLLDETLVLCLSEHGRTPQIDSKPQGAGRHHWSRAYSAVCAGSGIARGRVVGKTDPIGGDVANTPISPKDVQATTYHLLGIAPDSTVPDQAGRHYPIAGDGRVRYELLA